MAQKKLTKKTLMKSFHHWYYGNLTCFSQEHMQTFGYLTSMLPIVEELYDNKDQAYSYQWLYHQDLALKTNMQTTLTKLLETKKLS
jgi:mannose/fructose/N-acetylgalactosamine-specific phosphotransferase system component IID